MLIGKCNGFTLIEVLFAFSFFIVFSASVVPLLNIVYAERLSIQQEQKALLLLEETVLHYSAGENVNEREVEGIYITQRDLRGEIHYFCASWAGKNGREYETCFPASRS